MLLHLKKNEICWIKEDWSDILSFTGELLQEVHINDNIWLKKVNAEFFAASVVFPMKQVY